MKYELTQNSGGLSVVLNGEIDHHNIGPVREAVDKAVASQHPQVVELNFKGVEFMDSSGFGFIMGRYKSVSALGGRVEVTNCNKRIKKMLEMSGAGKYVKID
ncbi:MAG: STAS domain-containing protein [Bacillota bacterium]|nr:STAS domain-containing protein [Bacillota bacterium]